MPQTIGCLNARFFPGPRQAPGFPKPSWWVHPPTPPTRLATTAPAERPAGSIGVAQLLSWAGMALPLAACAAIWGLGDASPAHVAWLSILHGVIGAAVSVWTVLRLVLRRRARPGLRLAVAPWPRLSLVVLYALLAAQPVLAVAGSMLHGNHAALFGIPLPSVLPADPSMALQVDRLHGCNALLLLGLIATHAGCALRILRRRRFAG